MDRTDQIATTQQPTQTETFPEWIPTASDYGILGIVVLAVLYFMGSWVREQLAYNQKTAIDFLAYLREDRERLLNRDQQWSESVHEMATAITGLQQTVDRLGDIVDHEIRSNKERNGHN